MWRRGRLEGERGRKRGKDEEEVVEEEMEEGVALTQPLPRAGEG